MGCTLAFHVESEVTGVGPGGVRGREEWEGSSFVRMPCSAELCSVEGLFG